MAARITRAKKKIAVARVHLPAPPRKRFSLRNLRKSPRRVPTPERRRGLELRPLGAPQEEPSEEGGETEMGPPIDVGVNPPPPSSTPPASTSPAPPASTPPASTPPASTPARASREHAGPRLPRAPPSRERASREHASRERASPEHAPEHASREHASCDASADCRRAAHRRRGRAAGEGHGLLDLRPHDVRRRVERVFDYDCSGFVGYALDRVLPTGSAAIRVAQSTKRIYADDFEIFFRSIPIGKTKGGFRRVVKVDDLVAGDIVAWLRPADIVSDNTGHVLVVRGKPSVNPSRTDEMLVPITDATSSPHGSADSRYDDGATGLGTGTIWCPRRRCAQRAWLPMDGRIELLEERIHRRRLWPRGVTLRTDTTAAREEEERERRRQRERRGPRRVGAERAATAVRLARARHHARLRRRVAGRALDALGRAHARLRALAVGRAEKRRALGRRAVLRD